MPEPAPAFPDRLRETLFLFITLLETAELAYLLGPGAAPGR